MLEGQRFKRLVAFRATNERKGKSVVWYCLCDCSGRKLIPANKWGLVGSCGCLLIEWRQKNYERLKKYRWPLSSVGESLDAPLESYDILYELNLIADIQKHIAQGSDIGLEGWAPPDSRHTYWAPGEMEARSRGQYMYPQI